MKKNARIATISIVSIIIAILLILAFWMFFANTSKTVEFIFIETDIILNETDLDYGEKPHADFGPHCSPIHYMQGELTIEEHVYDDSIEVVVLIDYDMHHYDRKSFSWNLGDGEKPYVIKEKAKDLDIVSPVNSSEILFTISIDNGKIEINNLEVEENAKWNETFAYTIMNDKYLVTEVIELENIGNIKPTIIPSFPCM